MSPADVNASLINASNLLQDQRSKAPTVSENRLALVDGNLLLLEREVKVHVHRLRMSDVEVAVRLRRETSTDLTQTRGN